MANSTNNSTPKIIGAVVITSVVAVGSYVYIVNPLSSKTTPSTSTQTSSSTASPASQPNTPATSTAPATSTPQPTPSVTPQTDQTNNNKTQYYVPGGANSIDVTITTKAGVVTDVKNVHKYADRESSSYIQSFDSAIKKYIVGKNIKNVSPSRIGGASLTSNAFFEALQQISTQVNG